MTLDDLVHQQDDKTILGIGSKTAYFFFGTKAEYEEKIDKLSDELFDGMCTTSRTAMSLYRRKFKAAKLAAAQGLWRFVQAATCADRQQKGTVKGRAGV